MESKRCLIIRSPTSLSRKAAAGSQSGAQKSSKSGKLKETELLYRQSQNLLFYKLWRKRTELPTVWNGTQKRSPANHWRKPVAHQLRYRDTDSRERSVPQVERRWPQNLNSLASDMRRRVIGFTSIWCGLRNTENLSWGRNSHRLLRERFRKFVTLANTD